MDILISDKWLRTLLKTKATPKQLEKYLSLCGPSVEKVEKIENDFVYHIEVTTNRVDTASVYGIAREAAAILPRFKIPAKLKTLNEKPKQKLVSKVSYINATVDSKLCPRFTAVLIKDVKISKSPEWLQKNLIAVGERPINNIVDISNFVMHELGQPVHTFDYDKIKGAKMVLRESKKNEKITTLDGKEHKLPGGDIVIEDGSKKLIDLCGIMGGELSAVDDNTKNVLLFVQTYNPTKIRTTSMALAQRTGAAVLFEKYLDTELVSIGMNLAIELFEKITQGKTEKQILDIYPNPKKIKNINLSLEFIENLLGIKIKKTDIDKYLNSLGIKTSWKNNNLKTTIPSYRSEDMSIAEDVVEEIARIYGYHNLPSELMPGILPEKNPNNSFVFERSVKGILKELYATETYTLSLVPKSFVDTNKALRLKNPLGKDGEFLRTSLMPSLIAAAKTNSGQSDSFHIFEMANVYLPAQTGNPRKNKLPEEKLILAGIFGKTEFRTAKGVVEKLLNSLNISYTNHVEDLKNFQPSQRLVFKNDKRIIGEFGNLENGYTYYEFDMEKLFKFSNPIKKFITPPIHPPQIEDITLILPGKTKVGELLKTMRFSDKLISKVELKDIYKDSYTFNVWYQHKDKNLKDSEVKIIREKLLKLVKSKYGATQKD